MKAQLFIMTIFCSVYSFCQTKKQPTKSETQQWIKEKIEQNSYSDIKGEVKNNYEVSFDSTSIIVKNKNKAPYGSIDEYYKAKIVDINYITVKEDEAFALLSVKLQLGKSAIVTFNGKPFSDGSEILITLDKSFMQDNMPERMKKAFARLIELYGGKKSLEKDEPF